MKINVLYAKAGNFIKPAEIADTATREEVEAALRSAANEPTSIPPPSALNS